MSGAEFFSFILFTMIFYGTPGPATLSLAACGTAVGFRRSVPFLLGILSGLMFNLLLAAFGLLVLFDQFPLLRPILRYGALLYLLYLSVRIARSSVEGGTAARRPGYWAGLLINVLNPKAYAAALAILTQFGAAGDAHIPRALMLISTIFLITIMIDVAWCYAGELLRRPFRDPAARRRLNYALAALLLLSILITLL